MKFNYLSLLGVALMGLQQPVFAKRGTSAQSDESTQDTDVSSGTPNSQQPYCYTVPNGASYGGLDTNPTKNWLHQWIGTYYNGTIKIEIEIAEDSEVCGDQSGVLTYSYDGVLALAEMPAGIGGGDNSPFIFLLSGWEQRTEPSGDIDPLNSYLPSDVMIYMNAITDPRNEYWNGSTSWLIESNHQNDGYNFTGSLDDSPSAPADDSNWMFDAPPCNGSAPARFDMHPFDDLITTYDSDAVYAEKRNRVSGTFDPSEANVTWTGGFAGSFEDLKSTDGLKFGRYLMTFTGTVDYENSHILMTAGDSPTWETNPSLASATTTGDDAPMTTCVTYNSAVSFKSGLGKAGYGLAALAMIVTVLL